MSETLHEIIFEILRTLPDVGSVLLDRPVICSMKPSSKALVALLARYLPASFLMLLAIHMIRAAKIREIIVEAP